MALEENIDSATLLETADGVVGLNAFDRNGGFLTFVAEDAVEQVYFSRADLARLRDSIPAWLREMDAR